MSKLGNEAASDADDQADAYTDALVADPGDGPEPRPKPKRGRKPKKPGPKPVPRHLWFEQDDWRRAKLERLISEGVAANEAARRCNVSHVSFRRWWRSSLPNATKFRDEFAEHLGRQGYRGTRPESVLDTVEIAVKAGADPISAFRAAGVGNRRARGWLANNPEARERLATAQASVEQGLVNAIAAASGGDWRAAAWLLERKLPERWEAAKVRRELAQTPADASTIGRALQEAMALMALQHAGRSELAQRLIEAREQELLDAPPNAEVMAAEDRPEVQSIARLAGYGQKLLDEADPSMRRADESENVLRVDVDLLDELDGDDGDDDLLCAEDG